MDNKKKIIDDTLQFFNRWCEQEFNTRLAKLDVAPEIIADELRPAFQRFMEQNADGVLNWYAYIQGRAMRAFANGGQFGVDDIMKKNYYFDLLANRFTDFLHAIDYAALGIDKQTKKQFAQKTNMSVPAPQLHQLFIMQLKQWKLLYEKRQQASGSEKRRGGFLGLFSKPLL